MPAMILRRRLSYEDAPACKATRVSGWIYLRPIFALAMQAQCRQEFIQVCPVWRPVGPVPSLTQAGQNPKSLIQEPAHRDRTNAKPGAGRVGFAVGMQFLGCKPQDFITVVAGA